jgi:hypothetical protein
VQTTRTRNVQREQVRTKCSQASFNAKFWMAAALQAKEQSKYQDCLNKAMKHAQDYNVWVRVLKAL